MKKTIQKCFAVLLAIVLLCGSLPLTGLAAWPDGGIITGQQNTISWTVDLNTGTVTFFGTGAMQWCPFELHETVGENYPLNYYIHTVVISQGITELHNVLREFMELNKVVLPASLEVFDDQISAHDENIAIELDGNNPYFKLGSYGTLLSRDGRELIWAPPSIPSDYTIPDGVEVIRDRAFMFNKSLRTIVIPDSVTTIGEWAFAFCNDVETLTIGAHVQTIGRSAFDQLRKVKQLYIPASVAQIDIFAFDNLDDLPAFEVDAENPCYAAVDGVLMDKAQTTIWYYPLGSTRKTYTVPEGVTVIAEQAFSDAKNLESVTLPSSLRTIKSLAFFYSKKLSQITIPEGVRTIESSAFSSLDALETITIPGSVDKIGGIFGSDKNLHTIILRNGVQSIGSSVFSSLPALQTVHIPSSVTAIAANAFGKTVCAICTDSLDSAAAAFAREKGMTVTLCDHEPTCSAHDYVQTDRVEPTCTESGYIQNSCKNCGHISKECLDALGHDYPQWTYYSKSYHQGVCSRCGKKAVIAHTYEEEIVTKPTCVEPGENKLTCTACGTETRKEIAPLNPEGGHEWVLISSIPATCEESGEDTYECTRCGEKQTLGTCGPGHMFESVGDPDKDPVNHTIRCWNCGKTITEPHKFAHVVNPKATCTKDGHVIHVCNDCGYRYEETIPATGHTFGAWTYADEQTHVRVCSTDRFRETAAHNYVRDDAASCAPTEHAEGVDVFVCDGCGHSYEETIPPIPHKHTFAEWADDGDGLTHSRICEGCGMKETQDHSLAVVSEVPATCEDAGRIDRTCSVCGYQDAQTIPPTDHNYDIIVIDPTCTQAGMLLYRCDRCGKEYEEPGEPALGHTWGEWFESKPATPTEKGEQSRTCTRCGEAETRTIDTAEYTVRRMFMDTTGAYSDVTEETKTAVIGTPVLIEAKAEHGFVLSEDSVTSATIRPVGTVLEIKYERKQINVSFWATGEDGTNTLVEQQPVYYGAMIPNPPEREYEDFTVTGWYFEDGTTFIPYTADTNDINVYARIEPIDPEAAATEEELADLNAAIAALPDPENLYFYTDDAILRVAAALGSSQTDAAQFLTGAVQTGYLYEGAQTSRAVTAASGALRALTARGEKAGPDSLFAWSEDNGYLRLAARDESKARVNVRIEPIAVNGRPLDNADELSVSAGDRITFALRMTTNYYVSAADIPVVFDASRYYLVDQSGARYAYDANGTDGVRSAYDLIADEMISTQNVSKAIRQSYDIECYTVDSPALQYPAACRTPAFMQQYKIMLIEMMPHPSTGTKAQIFTEENSLLCTFTLEARADAAADGSEGTVGVPESWYADNMNHSNLFSVTRATGMRADGKTPAMNGTAAKYNFEIFDRNAQYGQTVSSTGASLSFTTGCAHDYVVIESVEPTETQDGTITYECTKCHDRYTDTIPATGATFELAASKAVRGGIMEVQINIRNNPGIVATRIWIEYDPEVLELEQVKNGNVFGEDAIVIGGDRGAVPYVVMWEDPTTHENHTDDGTLGTLVFKVRADAPLGETAIRLYYDTGSTFDVNLQERPFNVRSTSVTVSRLYGDADFDGKLTAKDIVKIHTHLVSNMDESVLPLSMDFNRDGCVNVKDTTLLARHLVGGWD